MPLPKGIYSDPQVRRAWIMERQAKLDAFDRLREKGLTMRQAAARLGLTHSGVRQLRANLEDLEARTTGHAKSARVDLGLALLSLANPPGPQRQALSAAEVAAWCGCTTSAVQSIERRALRKLHRKVNALLREQVITGDFGGDRLPALLTAAA